MVSEILAGERKKFIMMVGAGVLAVLAFVYACFVIWDSLHVRRAAAEYAEAVANSDWEAVFSEPDEKIPLHTFDKSLITTDENGYRIYRENGVKTSLTGIDVSKWNEDIDWEQVRNAGIEFVMIRIGNSKLNSGEITLDPRYEEYIEGAQAAGLKVGVYYYSQAVTVEEALKEAQFCIENLAGRDITFPVVFDTERYDGSSRADVIEKDLRTDIAVAFLNRIKDAGYIPAVYMNTSWSLTAVDLERLTEYDLWYAYYGEELYWPYRFTMWQYTDKASVPGIKGNTDLNIAFIDYSAR